MQIECNSWSMLAARCEVAQTNVPRIARLTLAVLIGLAGLVSLGGMLSATSFQIQEDRITVMAATEVDSPPTPSVTGNAVPTRCRRPVLSVTKLIEPDEPDTGEVVTITFVISGLGPKQVDVVLVQDVSGSMIEEDAPGGQSRLEIAKATAITFVNELMDTDRIAVVAYSATARSVLSLTTDTSAAIAAINALESREDAGWWTNIGDGIAAGYKELISSTQWRSKTAKSIVLLSDGNANRPEDDPGGHTREAAADAGECGILIYTIGFSDEVSETLMQDVAAVSGGEYYFSPNGANLETIYQEIALELRNLVITDVLPLNVELDCDLLPDAWGCITGSGLTTVTIPISNSSLETDPLILSFTATLGLDPGYEGPINAESSGICYDGPGGQTCQDFENPAIPVGGRKITGIVFLDLNLNGEWNVEEGEEGLPGQTVGASLDLKATTSITGFYVLRTSNNPTLTVTVEPPEGYIVTTPEVTVPPISGAYSAIIGLYSGLFPEKHSQDINGPPLFEGDALVYTITVRNISTTQRVGTVVITDGIPSFTTYTSGTADITPSGRITISATTVIASFTGTLDSKDAITLTFHVTVDEGAAGEIIHNQADIASTIQPCLLSRLDEEGPYQVELLPIPLFDLVASAQVVRPETEVRYTYTVSHTSPVATLKEVVVTDSHLGPIFPTYFSLPPDEPVKELTATAILTMNRANIATVTCGVDGYSHRISGAPATVTVHVIDGISLSQAHVEPSPAYYDDVTTLYYSVANRDIEEGVSDGTVIVTDTLGRILATTFFELDPNSSTPVSSQALTVPEDIVLTVTATGWDDIQGVLAVSDCVTLTLCPEDTYERDFNDDGPGLQVPLVAPNQPRQRHDFTGDQDWVGLQVHHSDESLYTFIALPLDDSGVPISLTLYQAGIPLAHGNNLGDAKSKAQARAVLSCPVDVCYYFLQLHSPASGCWTDYELWVEERPLDELWHIWIPAVLRNY